MLFFYGLHSAEPYFDILFTVTFVVMQLVKLGKYMHFCPKKPGWGTFGLLPEGGVIRSWCPPFLRGAPFCIFLFYSPSNSALGIEKEEKERLWVIKTGERKGKFLILQMPAERGFSKSKFGLGLTKLLFLLLLLLLLLLRSAVYPSHLSRRGAHHH